MKYTNKDCKQCGMEFGTHYGNKKYCSNKCFQKHRTIHHKTYSLNYYRIKRGTFKKWADELIKYGYTVIEPREITQ